jgi:cytochrome c peroxidase/PKD repeat protein
MSDDELSIGSAIAVHDTRRDTQPPEVAYLNPPDGSTGQPLTSRVGLSFTDQIELGSVTPETFIVRPVGGEPLEGNWGHMQTVVNFAPSEPLEPNTTYEVLLPAGGVTDLVGNAIASDFRSVFATGDTVHAPNCGIAARGPVVAGAEATLEVAPGVETSSRSWDFGDGSSVPASNGRSITHAWEQPGRYVVRLTVTLDGVTRSCSTTQIVHRALPSGHASRSSPIVIDHERGRALTVNPDASTITAVDLGRLEKVYEAPVGENPRTLAVGPTGRIWVVCQGSDEVQILSASDGTLRDTLSLRHGSAPYGIAFSPDGSAAWLTLQHTGQLARLDPGTLELTTVDLGPDDTGMVPQVRGVAVEHGGERVLVTRFVSGPEQGEVYDVDARTLEVRPITLVEDPGPDEKDSGRGVPTGASSVVISPDGTRAWVPSAKANTGRGLARDGRELTTDNTVRTIVSTIDLPNGVETLDERVDLDDHEGAVAAVASPVGDLLFVASQGTNQVDVLNAYSGEIVAGMATGLAPQGLVLDGEGRLAVQSFMSRSVSIFDVSGILDGSDNAASHLAEVSTVEEEPLSEALLLGKQLFYNADDPRMSLDGYLSCATCHPGGGSDERVWDFTDRGEGLRNTIDLRGRAGMAHGPVHWTGNFDEIQDFENDIRLHFGGRGFLAEEAWEEADRRDPLGAEKAGLSPSLDALAAYVASLNRFPSSPYRTPDGALTAAAQRGKTVFEELDCLDCHSGERLTDSGRGPRHDVGTIGPASGARRGEQLDGFDTPTLRGLATSAPYFHDGSATTLREVIEREGHGNAGGLSEDDKDALVAFLRQIENEPLGYMKPPEGSDAGPPPDAGMEPSASSGGCGCHAAPSLPRPRSAMALGLLTVAWVVRRRRRCR